MTLLASERSLLIRNKFRSVLQLRIQNRRQSEINADPGLKSACPAQKTEKDQSEALRLTDDGAAQKLPPSGLNTETTPEKTVCGAQRHKKARQSQDLTDRIQRLPGSVQQPHEKHTPPLENRAASFPLPADVFEDDISSCSSSSPSKPHGLHQSAAFPSLQGLSGDQLLSDFSAVAPPLNKSPGETQSGLALLPATEGIRQPLSITPSESNSMATTGRPNGMYVTSQTTPLLPKTAQPSSPPISSSLPPSLNFTHLPRPRKPRDTKPKMRTLTYHQYIPPNQRGGSGTGGTKQKSPTPSLDPAYSNLLKQQQVILQLQILQNQQQQQQQQKQQLQPQQQLMVVPSVDHNDLAKSAGAMPLNPLPVPATTNQTPSVTDPKAKPEPLPANLVDLTVSELRQHLRKRGLPVSGTKPTLLQRLRPFQLPHSCPTPAPLCQLGTSLEPLTPYPLLSPSQSPSSSSSSGPDSPNRSPNEQMYIPDRAIANGILSDASTGVPNGILNTVQNGFSAGENCSLTNVGFLAPASTASGTPSPSLPMSSSSPLQCGTSWRTENEKEQQQQQELSVELEMRERLRSRPRDRSANTSNESCGGSLHPFLQQDPGCSRGKRETDAPTEVLYTQVFCCQPCDVIGQDFELPVQITASPVQTSPGVRSLEEELLEAIQKAQMDPRQSIDDILDEPITCAGSEGVSDYKSPAQIVPGPSPPSPPPQADQSQASQHHTKDDSFLPSPLCSSLLLELPPSPAVINPNQVIPAPPPPPICTSPLSSLGKSRKRRAPTLFDAADWLETMTSGFRPLTPPTAPFVEPDLSLDSDLNVSRVLDLMIEQW